VIGAHVFKEAGALETALQKPLAAVEHQFLVPLAQVGTVFRGDVLPTAATARFHAVHLDKGLAGRSVRRGRNQSESIAAKERPARTKGGERLKDEG
jgi:hypothetical protein